MKADSYFFFFNDTATTEIYTLSLHDALPISWAAGTSPCGAEVAVDAGAAADGGAGAGAGADARSEEHTSELQSQSNLVCRLLLEKKKKQHVTRGDGTEAWDSALLPAADDARD